MCTVGELEFPQPPLLRKHPGPLPTGVELGSLLTGAHAHLCSGLDFPSMHDALVYTGFEPS